MPAVRFAVSPPWRFVVTNLNMATLTFLDRLASSRSISYILNQAASATVVVPSESPEVNILTGGRPFVTNSDRLLFGFRRDDALGTSAGDIPWTVRFAGIVQQVGDKADAERSQTTVIAFDPWQYLYARPVCNADGSLPGETGISFTATRGDVIALTLLYNTIVNQGSVFIDAGLFAAGSSPNGIGDMGTGLHEGPLQQTALLDMNFQRGTTVGEAWRQITNTGNCDIVLTPIFDPVARQGFIVDLAIYTQAGSQRDNAIFAWDKPSKSLIALDRLVDAAQMANRVLFFNGQGGPPVFETGTTPPSDLLSINQYGEYWYTQAFPGQTVEEAVLAMAETQVQLRAQGKTTVTFTPAPERSPDPFVEYWLGDTVPIYASDRFRQAIP